jgi:predicted lysophospholipase L1 biosynthesis ABC-type transport system permease subunit
MDKNTKRWLVLAAIVLAAVLVAVYDVTTYMPSPPPLSIRRGRITQGDIEIFYMGKSVVSTVNVALLIFLLATYIDLYRKVQSEFTIALTVFSMVLLLYALASNPIVYRIFGFHAFGLGPFAILPDIFSCIAVGILIYLSFKY